jgi:hypothetical protein
MKTATVLAGNTAIDGEIVIYLVECGGAPTNLLHVALLTPPWSVSRVSGTTLYFVETIL